MTTSSNVEQLERRTPHAPDGFRYLNQPQSPKVLDIQEGRFVYFDTQTFPQRRAELREYFVQIDQAAFRIGYWDAMKEVVYNTRPDAAVNALLFEPNEALRSRLSKVYLKSQREKGLSGVFNRLPAPFAGFFNPSAESEIDWDLPFAGYATQETWRVNTDLGVLTTAYFSTMAFVPGFTGAGLGPLALQYMCNFLKFDILAARLQNGAAGSAIEKANVGEGKFYGVEAEWHEHPLRETVTRLFEDRTLHPNGIDREKLIAVAVYPEGENRAYEYGRTKGRASEITDMLRARGVDPKNGDGAYIAMWGKGRERLWIARHKSCAMPLATPRLDIN